MRSSYGRLTKSNTFVVLDREVYLNKLQHILDDPNQFCRIRKDVADDIRKRINYLIDVVNAVRSPNQFTKLEGHYEPGYIYGNPKIHRSLSDPPLRPIISQIGTPVYHITRAINNIISK
jgi:hypothetical protein